MSPGLNTAHPISQRTKKPENQKSPGFHSINRDLNPSRHPRYPRSHRPHSQYHAQHPKRYCTQQASSQGIQRSQASTGSSKNGSCVQSSSCQCVLRKRVFKPCQNACTPARPHILIHPRQQRTLKRPRRMTQKPVPPSHHPKRPRERPILAPDPRPLFQSIP